MFRAALPALRSALPSARPSAFAAAARFQQPIAVRTYAAAAGLSRSDIESRVMEVMKTFEKVDGGKLSASATFTSDLGLDSLDAVEVVMAIEEEFGIEIPDAEADEITTVKQAIDYVEKTPEGGLSPSS
ncbi:acyl carrier protein-like protein [Dioszegia hungarica]|uniref:Acyl carrier protein n=1 Tax=Dioszegia hungarica TaxID=4972 RepID=A0AA38H5R4_9TREE|nr:acyl carrier protein-like protein [Dioszegia hungarica]KAI9634685.1 acyl carrier protein-like protein [Dioszegia hungarica]